MVNIFDDYQPNNTLHSNRLPNLSLDDILNSIGPLPDGTIVLGIGHDRLPVLINLYHAETGAILIAGDADCGKTTFIQNILRCAGRLNPDQISITMISHKYYLSIHFEVTSMHLDQCRPYTAEVNQYINSLNLLCKKRLSKEENVPFILFVVEDLGRVYSCLNLHEQERFMWLLENGPSAGIWPICTITLDQSDNGKISKDVIESFRTLLWGYVSSPGTVVGLEAADAAPLSHLIKHREFCMHLDSGWLRFSILESPKTAGDGLSPSFHIPDSVINATRGGHHEYWHVMV